MFNNADLYFEDNYNLEPRVNLLRQRRFMRNYSNPMELPTAVFIANFRLSKDAFMFVLLKLYCALRFFAHGSYQQTVGTEFQLGLAQPTHTVSLILKKILPILEK